MIHPEEIPLVRTIRERCRVCYTCVRECPAKAIRIAEGQAEVMPERCIACGNCVRVCSQNAKVVLSSIPDVQGLLSADAPVAACLAPSFPAEFPQVEARQLVGMLRRLGFKQVHEVAFGADLVARRYRQLLQEGGQRRFIATTCPAVVAFVERYAPDTVASLAPIVSPMIAEARALKQLYGQGLKIVFIGPCIAKKGEASSQNTPGEVDAVLTFAELRAMLDEAGIQPQTADESDFDPPHGGLGALFPISRGMLQAAGIAEDLAAGEIVSADGRGGFAEAIREFESGALQARLLEVLACSGCIMGPGTTGDDPLFARRAQVARYVRQVTAGRDKQAWQQAMDSLADLPLERTFTPQDQRIPMPFQEEISLIMSRMGKHEAPDELNCGACGYDTCREHAMAIFKGLAESEMCLPYTIEQHRRKIEELAVSRDQLAAAQEALMQSEKLASMGQLAAGIAHEVNNPLGVVLMYSHLLLEETAKDSSQREDLSVIAREADRCKKIVAGLLNFARQTRVVMQPTNVPELVDRCLRALTPPAGVIVTAEHEMDEPMAELDADQITQVLTNLVTNAYGAMPSGGTLKVRTTGDGETVRIRVTDSGVGIPRENMGKIFEPFFTTKQIGKGTGLGLAVTYGIVKMHRGEITVESNADQAVGPTGSSFKVTLPRKGQQE